MEFNIKVEGVEKVMNELNDIAKRQLPFALARALTQTAKAIQEDEIKEMKQTFDRPTPFILNSLRIEPATKTNLQAKVCVKDAAVKILSPHIFGGERQVKRFEFHLRRAGILPEDKYITPGACAPLDRYGNIPGGVITRILSALKAHPDIYAWRTARSIKRRRGTNTCMQSYLKVRKFMPGYMSARAIGLNLLLCLLGSHCIASDSDSLKLHN